MKNLHLVKKVFYWKEFVQFLQITKQEKNFSTVKTSEIMKTVKLVLLTIVMMINVQFAIAQDQKIISTKVIGKGQPIIMIHGMSCSADVWDEVADYYKDRYEVHLVTLVGFGNKLSVEVPNFLEAVKDELVDYTRKNNLKNTILMGHSMGGFLSYWAASDDQELFSKIVVVDGLPYFPALQGLTVETAKAIGKNIRKNAENADESAQAASQKLTVASMIGTETKREKVVQMGINSNQRIIGQAFEEMFTTDLRDRIANIQIPVLVLSSWYGGKDYGATKEFTRMSVESQTSKINDVQIEIADTALHFIFYDEPEWFFSKVDLFLK